MVEHSDDRIPVSDGGTSWGLTGRIRYVLRRELVPHPADPTIGHYEIARVLQQEWVELGGRLTFDLAPRRTEWRDVPTEQE